MGDDLLAEGTRVNALQRALEEDEIRLFCQPQADAVSGKITGMEALLRWIPDESGAVLEPGDFMPLAEESGLLIPIGEWLVHEACRQHVVWMTAGGVERTMTVNVSACQLAHGDLEAIEAPLLDWFDQVRWRRDFNPPSLSLTTGKFMTEGFRTFFRDWHIEDLTVDYAAVSCDLVAYDLAREELLWRRPVPSGGLVNAIVTTGDLSAQTAGR